MGNPWTGWMIATLQSVYCRGEDLKHHNAETSTFKIQKLSWAMQSSILEDAIRRYGACHQIPQCHINLYIIHRETSSETFQLYANSIGLYQLYAFLSPGYLADLFFVLFYVVFRSTYSLTMTDVHDNFPYHEILLSELIIARRRN